MHKIVVALNSFANIQSVLYIIKVINLDVVVDCDIDYTNQRNTFMRKEFRRTLGYNSIGMFG